MSRRELANHYMALAACSTITVQEKICRHFNADVQFQDFGTAGSMLVNDR